MPRIERYTRGIVRNRPVADIVNPQAISDAGSGFHAAAGILNTGAQIADKIVEARETTAVNEAIIRNKKRKMEFLEQARKENMSSPDDFAKRIEPDLKKIDEEFLQGLPTERAKSVFQQRMQDVNFSAYQQNSKWEQSRHVEMAAERVEGAALESGNLAYIAGSTGAPLDDIRKDAEATIIAASTVVGNSPEKIAEVTRSTMKTVERNYAMGLMGKDPQAAIDYLNDIEQSGNITAGDRVNLINTAQNVIEAKEREAERAETKRLAAQALQSSMIKERVFSGGERPEDLILEIREMEANKEIGSSLASDLVKVVNAKKRARKPEDVSEADKNDFFIEIRERVENLVLSDDFSLTADTLKEFGNIEARVYAGVQEGLATRAQSESLLKDLRAQVQDAMDNENVEYNTLAAMAPGVQYPISYALGKIDTVAGNSPMRQRMIMSKFADLMADYKSSGNKAKDEETIDDALNKALKMYNKGINYKAAEQKANGVVDAIRGTYKTKEEAMSAVQENGWESGVVVIDGVKYPIKGR